MNIRPLLKLCLACLLLTASQANAIIINESIHGDFSGVPGAPSSFMLDAGDNLFSGSTIGGDFDIIHMTISTELIALELVGYTSIDNLGFIAMQSGAIWTEGLGGAINPANLLGWSHFGPGNGTVGTDILDDMAISPGSIGFSLPLGSGDYTFLIQQTGGAQIDYQFNFITAIPEPSLWALMAFAVLMLSIRHRRQ